MLKKILFIFIFILSSFFIFKEEEFSESKSKKSKIKDKIEARKEARKEKKILKKNEKEKKARDKESKDKIKKDENKKGIKGKIADYEKNKFNGGIVFSLGGGFSRINTSFLFRYDVINTGDIPVIGQFLEQFNAPVYLSNVTGFDTHFTVNFSYFKKKSSSVGFVNRFGYKFQWTEPFGYFLFGKQMRLLNSFFSTISLKNSMGNFDKNFLIFIETGFYFSVFFQNFNPEQEGTLPFGVGIGPVTKIGLEYHKNKFLYGTSFFADFIFRIRGKNENYMKDSDIFLQIDLGLEWDFGYLTKKRFNNVSK